MPNKNKIGSTEIIKQIAESLGYTASYISTAAKPKRLLISDGNKVCVVNASIFGFYPEVKRWHQHLFDSKLLTQEVLQTLGYKTIDTVSTDSKSHKSILEFVKHTRRRVQKFPVIVKPEKGFKGQDISIVSNVTQLDALVKESFKNHINLLIQPILEFDEYRILLVNNQVEVVHIKQLHCVTGDGSSTIQTLLTNIPEREQDKSVIKQNLRAKQLHLKSILPKGQKFIYHLTRFSAPGEYYQANNISPAIKKWAKTLASKISSPTMGIDVFTPNGITDPDNYLIIELNANPAFDYIKYRYDDDATMKRIISSNLQHYFKS